MHAPSEIRNLELTMDTDEYVLRFDIPMNHMFPVQELQRRRHLGNIRRGLPFWEPSFATKMFIQLPRFSKFQNQEYPLAVVEMAVKLEDVGVPEVALDFNFSLDLPLDAVGFNFIFVHDLEGTDEAAAPFPSQVHASEFPLS